MLRVRLPTGVLPYIEVVVEHLRLIQSDQREGTNKVLFEKNIE